MIHHEVIVLTLSVTITITKERIILIGIGVNDIPLSAIKCVGKGSGSGIDRLASSTV